MIRKIFPAFNAAAVCFILATGFYSSSVKAYAPQFMPLIPVNDFNLLVYGSARAGVLYESNQPTVADGASRLGFAFGKDLGNGLGAYGVYEFWVYTPQGSIITSNMWGSSQPWRFSYVGLKGDWGAVTVGAQWAPLAGAIGNYMDRSNYFGGYSYFSTDGAMGGQYRIIDSVSYQRCWSQDCQKALFMDAQLNSGGDDLDRTTIGGNWKIKDLMVGAAYQNHGADDFRGVSFQMPLKLLNKDSSLAGGYVSMQSGAVGWDVNLQWGNWWFDYAFRDDLDIAKIIVDYTHTINKNTAFITEGYIQDETSSEGLVMLLKFDF